MKLKLLVIALILTVILGTIAFVPMERGDTEIYVCWDKTFVDNPDECQEFVDPPPVPGDTTDTDRDGVPDSTDNCINVNNPDQRDADNDGVGDSCDTQGDDADGDGVLNAADNCPQTPNPDQADADGDGVGDACEVLGDDYDGDGVRDDVDNCPTVANPDQADRDNDGVGNACETALRVGWWHTIIRFDYLDGTHRIVTQNTALESISIAKESGKAIASIYFITKFSASPDVDLQVTSHGELILLQPGGTPVKTEIGAPVTAIADRDTDNNPVFTMIIGQSWFDGRQEVRHTLIFRSIIALRVLYADGTGASDSFAIDFSLPIDIVATGGGCCGGGDPGDPPEPLGIVRL